MKAKRPTKTLISTVTWARRTTSDGKPGILHYDHFGATFDYFISGSAIEESLNPKQQAKSVNKGVHLSMTEHLDEKIEHSIEAEENANQQKNKQGERDTHKVNGGVLCTASMV